MAKKKVFDPTDLSGYKPSRLEMKRLEEIQVTHVPDGSIELQDSSSVKWSPSEKQTAFLEHLLDEDTNTHSLPESAEATDCKMKDIKRWCRREPEFLALFKERVKERFELGEAVSDLVVLGAAEGRIQPTKNQRWGIEQISKIRSFIHQREVRFLQINQQFNMGPQADMDDEALLRVINAGSETAKNIIDS